MARPYPGRQSIVAVLRFVDQSSGDSCHVVQAAFALIAEIFEVERFEQQATEHIQRFADDLDHLVASRGMLVVRPIL
jgi:hypothetical protein